jgi:adenylate kinase
MINVIISGAPGSGKGTQSDLIVENFRFKHLSTGDLLRAELAAKTDLGQAADGFISKGELVPDELVINILVKAFDNADGNYNGLILDGFPRTVGQAEALEEIFEQRGRQIDVFLDVDVEESELIDRLLKRGETSGRKDDNLETIKERLNVYHQKTEPVSDFYKKTDKYKRINGNGKVEEIHKQISEVLTAAMNKKTY